MSKRILVTGAAGFIGAFLSKSLLEKGNEVIGLDNLNDYYDPKLKLARLEMLKSHQTFTFVKEDLVNSEKLNEIFEKHNPEIVVNLAAQAGVRYSIENPQVYINSNIIGFFNILEACRNYPVEHLVYASSSSVYGANKKVPFSTEDKVDNPVSLYAATKKSNELMAHCYSKLYGIPATGLRFFTVYGPMGRPDMAYFSFTQKILNNEPIKIFNNGDMYRDFTYVDDIVEGIENVMSKPPVPNDDGVKYKVYNIGNNKPEKLMDYIECLEKSLSKVYGREIKAKKEFLPMQAGDVPRTFADVSDLIRDFGFKPDTSVQEGLDKFAVWYKEFYG
ncbi:MAG: NAD-dependent epimerase [Clostridia bacterium]|nr:NAD-dependent epimerase [Clostridia bacterium]